MSRECTSFRTTLEAELLGRHVQERLTGLSWHEHLLSCDDCRGLLEREEALEMLLASLPEPRLPEALARRVIRRLREDRSHDRRLDVLLGLDAEVRAPGTLAADVLARLASERGRAQSIGEIPSERAVDRLDDLLELDRAVEVPDGLARHVLARLVDERRTAEAPRVTIPILRRHWIYAAAAGLLLTFLGRLAWMRTHAERDRGAEPIVVDFTPHSAGGTPSEPPVDPNLLAALDVLEEWDLLMQDDVDVLLSTLPPADLALLDYR
jgi:hypothetical protein